MFVPGPRMECYSNVLCIKNAKTNTLIEIQKVKIDHQI